MPQNLIQMRDIHVPLSPLFALKDINYGFASGKTYVILGESGGGKSTLIRTIAGLVPYSEGEILIDGIKVCDENMKELSLKVGYMPQNYGLFPHLSVKRNVSLQAELLGWSEAAIDQRLNEMMSLVLLPEEHLEKFPSELSGGQRQRVALMRCLFMNQPIFLFDEPLSALDPHTKEEIIKEWKDLFGRLKKLVIMVTHSPTEASALGDQILIMEGGVLREGGAQP